MTAAPCIPQVRVGSLQELVYKNGQAGVTKASVSIIFNNEDKANSPIGYEQYDQITVTRQARCRSCRFCLGLSSCLCMHHLS